MGKTTRRVFVGTGLFAVSMAGVSLFACGIKHEKAAFERLDVLLADICDPVRVGTVCRSVYNISELKKQAESKVHIATSLRIGCQQARLTTLKQGIREEFASRDIIVCDRFVLAHTEYIIAGLRLERALSL